MTGERSQHADARYDCNPILGGGDDVVTRSHENLLSTVRGTSRCKARFWETSMPLFNSHNQNVRGRGIAGTVVVEFLVLLALGAAVVRYLQWSSETNQAEFINATRPSASDPNHSDAAPLYHGPYFPLF